ncbi:MAG: hypothetical protein APF76_14785 [Desulfitibacter sp. BRH_c19]|nr:MAG: hypothetical protein APF76_14785 [Desulfitibacter sp. BRH_c19]
MECDSIFIIDILTAVFIGALIVNAGLNYKAKKLRDIPSSLMIAYFLLLRLFLEYIPLQENIKGPFIYSGLVIAILASLLASRFYRKRGDRIRYWFNLILAGFLGIAMILGILGIIQ